MMLRSSVIFLMCILFVTTAFAEQNLLSTGHSAKQLASMLISEDQWKPFPTAADRAAWNSLPEAMRKAYIQRGEAALNYDWPALKATDFLDYVRTGNRSRYQALRGRRRGKLLDLVMAECMEGKGRFIDQIANGVWATCEETWWGIPAHVGAQKAGRGLPDINEPIVALFSAETGAQLAWTVYMLGPELNKVSPMIVPRVRQEIERQILTPCLERNDFGWMGFPDRRVNNWNPWINSNWLTCALLMEQNPERRTQAVAKILRSLDNFLNHYPKDGGCDEGPGYWGRAGASLFDCLELMDRATDGKFNVYNDPLVQNIGRYIYKVHIDGPYFVNFADASPRPGLPADLVYRYGKRINDPTMVAFGAWGAKEQKLGTRPARGSMGRQLFALFELNALLNTPGAQPRLRDVWLPDLEVFAARDQGGSGNGLYVAAKGGNNGESHNHNDVGNFVVYRNGLPVLIDVGSGTYDAKTFSRDRYKIWMMQSAYHNLPTIGGVMERQGRSFAAKDLAYKATNKSAQLSMDVAGAYPSEAGLASWKRTVRLDRGKNVMVVDAFKLKKRASNIALSLMTPCEVTIAAPGKLVLKGEPGKSGDATILYDAKKLKATTEAIPLKDRHIARNWGKLTRILLTAESPAMKDKWTVTVTP